jgi:formate/nitrite transporter FocA (FNT family)
MLTLSDAEISPSQSDPSSGTAVAEHDPFEPHSVATMLDRVADVIVEKAANPAAYLLRSLVGGAMVAFGVLLSLIVSTGIAIPGSSSLLMGLAFGFSFVLILVSGMSLITADIPAGLIAVLQHRLTTRSYLRLLGIGLVGNLAGTLLFVTIAAAAGGPYLKAPFTAHALTVALSKASSTAPSAILLGVLCTWFLQTAMFMYFKARTDVARIAFAFYGPFAFVAGATQHVIANAGFIGLPLLTRLIHGHAAHVPARTLSWGLGWHGLLRNVALTASGNVAGGVVLVAVPFYLIARLQSRTTTPVQPPGDA